MSHELVWAVLVYAAAVPAVIFPFLYGFLFPFWKSVLGQALMTTSVGIAVVMVVTCLRVTFGDGYPYQEEVRIVGFSLVTIGFWWQLLAICKVWYSGRIEAEQARAIRDYRRSTDGHSRVT